MEEDSSGRHRQLEREIECLKDTIWRLTSRICVMESFLKSKFGSITVAQPMSISSSPVKMIPIVVPESNQVVDSAGDSHQLTLKDIDPLDIVEGVVEEEVTSSDPILDENENGGGGYGENFEEGTTIVGEEVSVNEITIEGTEDESTTVGDTASEAPDGIRIYKPELKTFVTVKMDASAIDGPNHVSATNLECHICHKAFSQQENVQRHLLSHRAGRFKCDECGREFSHQGNLKTHKLRHERELRRKLEMEERKKSVKQKPQMDVENRKFPCSYCEKRFYTSQQRNIHTRIHTGEKPFGCNVCGMRFSQKASLQDHCLGHVGEKNNCCHLCPSTFARARNLLKHIRQVHKMVQIKTVVSGERVVEFVPESEAASIIESRKDNVESKKSSVRSRSQRPKRQSTTTRRKDHASEAQTPDRKHIKPEVTTEYVISADSQHTITTSIST